MSEHFEIKEDDIEHYKKIKLQISKKKKLEKEEKFLINEEEVKVYITKVRATNLGGELVIGNQFIFSYKGHLYVIMLSTLPEKFSEFRFIEEGLSKMRWEMP